jgi:RNA polymerase sigma-70 factor (ECF subfamily)
MPQQCKYPNDPEQTKWIVQTKQGDQTAFRQIVERYQRPVYNICYHMLRNPEDAEDAAQEVFLRAYAKLDTYDDGHHFSTWLFAIASHYCMDRWKRRSLPLVSWDSSGACLVDRETTQPEKVMLEAETSQEVRNLLQILRPDYRLLIIMKYWHTMSYEEIAKTLDTTVSTIKSKLFRAHKIMAQAVTQEEGTTNIPSGMTLAASY